MTVVSYAQNFEDIMLWRALQHVKDGFYIDVGACWPEEHSVTHIFYSSNWRGINIEPNPSIFKDLERLRTRDVNLNVGISTKNADLPFYIIPDSGLSTFNFEIASQHERDGFVVQCKTVSVTSLSSVWAENVPEDQDVHFLKVDVEGFERAVLESNDWSKDRPWVLVVESTLPMTQSENHESWESILLSANYLLAYTDGLNRFYVAEEHSYLLEAFKYPPNIFDDFITANQNAAELKSRELISRVDKLTKDLNLAHMVAPEKDAQISKLSRDLCAAEEKYREDLSVSISKIEMLKRELADKEFENQAFQRSHEEITKKVESLDQQNIKAAEDIRSLMEERHQWWLVADNLSRELQSVYGSRSWIITSPFRQAFWALKCVVNFFIERLIRLIQFFFRITRHTVAFCIRVSLRSKVVTKILLSVLRRAPYLKRRLRRFALNRGLISPELEADSVDHAQSIGSVSCRQELTGSKGVSLSPQGRRIYRLAKFAIDQKYGDNA